MTTPAEVHARFERAIQAYADGKCLHCPCYDSGRKCCLCRAERDGVVHDGVVGFTGCDADTNGRALFVVERPPLAAKHGHTLAIMQAADKHGVTGAYYIEVTEPGACQCVRRVDMAVLVHALLNMKPEEIKAAEARGACAQCGHRHHLDDKQ